MLLCMSLLRIGEKKRTRRVRITRRKNYNEGKPLG